MFHQNLGGVFMQRNELDSALYQFKMAENFAVKLNNETSLAQCYLNIGNVYNQKDEYVKAFEYWLKCKSIAKRKNDFELQSKIAMAMGDAYVYLGEVGASIGSFQEASDLAYQCDNKQLQILSMVKLSKGKFYQEKYHEALDLLSVVEILLMSGIGKELKAVIYLAQGACHLNLNNFEMADKKFGLVQKEYEKKGAVQNSSLIWNIAGLRFKQNRYHEALEAFKKSREMEIEMDSYSIIRTNCSRNMYEIYTTRKGQNIYFMFHQNLGGVFMLRNELDSALYQFKMAENFAVKLNNETSLAQCYLNIGNVYNQKDEYVKAFEYWLKCKSIAKRKNDFELQSKIAMAMGRCLCLFGRSWSLNRPIPGGRVTWLINATISNCKFFPW